MEEVLQGKNFHLIELFFTLAWLIWGNRNNILLQKPGMDAVKMGEKASAYVEEYKEVMKKVEASSTIMVQKWIPPPDPRLKMNVATKYYKSRNAVGVGVVVRNSSGEFMGGYCVEIPSLHTGLQWVAAAMIKALQFGVDAGFKQLIVEFPHPHFMAFLQSNVECLTELGDQLEHIHQFSAFFEFLSFSVISVSCNRAAKILAEYAKVNKDLSIWLEDGPAFILPIVLAELS